MNKSAPTSLPLLKRLLYGFTNWTLFAAGLLNLIAGTWFSINQNATDAATSLTAGLVLLLAATIDRFESLKGLGVEAKTRQLDEKIEQADDALRRLKELTELAGAALVDLNSKMGRWDSAPTPRDAYALAQKVRSIMSALGSDQTAIHAALKPWVRTMCGDIASAIVAPLHKAITEKIREVENQRSAIRQPTDPNDPELLRTTSAIREGSTYLEQRLRKIRQFEADDYPDRFIQLFDDVPLLDPEVLAQIRTKALQFAPTMAELRQELQLSNPEPWFFEIEEHRKHH